MISMMKIAASGHDGGKATDTDPSMETPVPSHADTDANEQLAQASEAAVSLACGSTRHGVNLARFDLVSLRLAVLCADMGSLSAAVKRLHCSLSTGSHRLSMLEDALGTQLFMRDHRGLHLTDAGALLVQHCRAILAHVELMSQHVASELLSPRTSHLPKVEVSPSHDLKVLPKMGSLHLQHSIN